MCRCIFGGAERGGAHDGLDNVVDLENTAHVRREARHDLVDEDLVVVLPAGASGCMPAGQEGLELGGVNEPRGRIRVPGRNRCAPAARGGPFRLRVVARRAVGGSAAGRFAAAAVAAAVLDAG